MFTATQGSRCSGPGQGRTRGREEKDEQGLDLGRDREGSPGRGNGTGREVRNLGKNNK